MKLLFTYLFVLVCQCSFSQRCGTYEYHEAQAAGFKHLQTPLTLQPGRDTLSNEVIVVPVVVHVLYHNSAENISDEQILSQVASLNNDFRRRNADAENTPIPFQKFAADVNIVFCLAKVDPNGRNTSGIIRKYSKDEFWLSDDEMKFSSKGGDNAWDASRYLNIWVCNLFGRTLGYGVFPGGPPERDGLVIQYNVFGTTGNLKTSFNKGRTTTHEVGHWLGLKHIWGDVSCGDDGVDDTPPQQTSNLYCPKFPHTSLCSRDTNGDMFMNYMDFTDDACMNLFTQGQKKIMRSQFATGRPRNLMLQGNLCDSSLAQGSPTEEEVVAQSPVSLYPNPFTSELTITGGTDIAGKKVEVFDITGRLYTSRTLITQKTTLSLPNLKAGVYLVKISDETGSHVFKVVRQRPL